MKSAVQQRRRLPAARGVLGAVMLAVAALLAACGGGGDSVVEQPVLTISGATSLTAVPVTLSFSFTQDVGSSFTADDVVVSGGTAGALTKVDGSHYTMLVSPPALAGSGVITVTVAGSAYANTSSASGSADSRVTQAYDTVAPTLALGSSAAGGTASGAFTVTFTFSEDVGASFTDADVKVVFTSGTGGSVGALTRVSATQATLLITPPAGVAGTANISVAVGAFADLAGGTNASAYFGGQVYDTRSPS